MIRNAAIVFICVCLVTGLSLPGISQTRTELEDYFKNSIGLSNDQIADIRRGKAVGKVLKSRAPARVNLQVDPQIAQCVTDGGEVGIRIRLKTSNEGLSSARTALLLIWCLDRKTSVISIPSSPAADPLASPFACHTPRVR